MTLSVPWIPEAYLEPYQTSMMEIRYLQRTNREIQVGSTLCSLITLYTSVLMKFLNHLFFLF